jgi:hypothetical protein
MEKIKEQLKEVTLLDNNIYYHSKEDIYYFRDMVLPKTYAKNLIKDNIIKFDKNTNYQNMRCKKFSYVDIR